jgi:hypothetical protein
MTLLAGVMIAALAQTPVSSVTVDATRQQFQDLEARLLSAVQAKNATALESLVSSSFAFSLMVEGRSPEVMSRGEWLRQASAYSRLEGFELSAVAAGSSGDYAMVRAQVKRTGTVGPKELSGEFVFIDLWAKEDGAWRIRYRVVARPVPPLTR